MSALDVTVPLLPLLPLLPCHCMPSYTDTCSGSLIVCNLINGMYLRSEARINSQHARSICPGPFAGMSISSALLTVPLGAPLGVCHTYVHTYVQAPSIDSRALGIKVRGFGAYAVRRARSPWTARVSSEPAS